MLDKKGLMLAAIMGLILFLININYLIIMLSFLFLSVIVTKHRYYMKKEMGIYEHERSWENVLSNGTGPVIFALITPWFGIMPYLCSIAAVMADKFASELGVLSADPISLKDLKKVKPGTSGAISLFGTLTSLVGAIIIGLISMVLFNLPMSSVLIIGVIGFIGSMIDSIFGIFEEMKIGTKGTTNFICSISAGILAIFFVMEGII